MVFITRIDKSKFSNLKNTTGDSRHCVGKSEQHRNQWYIYTPTVKVSCKVSQTCYSHFYIRTIWILWHACFIYTQTFPRCVCGDPIHENVRDNKLKEISVKYLALLNKVTQTVRKKGENTSPFWDQ